MKPGEGGGPVATEERVFQQEQLQRQRPREDGLFGVKKK